MHQIKQLGGVGTPHFKQSSNFFAGLLHDSLISQPGIPLIFGIILPKLHHYQGLCWWNILGTLN